MSFVSFSFIILFLMVLACRLTIGRRKTEPAYFAVLIGASMIFYSWHVPSYIVLLLTSVVIDFFAGKWIARLPRGSHRRRLLLALSLATNLGLLGVFKYADFSIRLFEDLFGGIGDHPLTRLDVVLPMGISFYTFQSMSYTIDLYRGALKPVERFSRFFLFVSFFPQLVAGPIVRANEFLYQLPRRRRLWLGVANEGFFLLIRGFFLKMVCADNLAVYVNSHWKASEPTPVLAAVTVMFSFQIFCDFAGYSSIARGLAYLLGFRLPVNFNSPYVAGSFSNFWQRWHITLSTWLRDYLYIPLGGNRRSRVRTYVNLMIVMLLGGLWHGAATTFVLWGAVHGAALVIERLLGLQRITREPGHCLIKFAWYAIVQLTVLLTWILFRSESGTQAIGIVQGILAFRFPDYVPSDLLFSAMFLIPPVLMHSHQFLVERGWIARVSPMQKAVLAGFMLVAIFVFYGQDNAFIYFQF